MTNTTPHAADVDRLMDAASDDLVARRYSSCEHRCLRALALARTDRDADRIGRIALPLQESRRQRRLAALDSGRVELASDAARAAKIDAPGCYLVVPPLDRSLARSLRDRLSAADVDAIVLAVEHGPHAGQARVVASGGVETISVPIPALPAAPDASWVAWACELLTEAGLAAAAAEPDPRRRIDRLIDLLDAHPCDEKMHQALAEICQVASRTGRPGPSAGAGPRAAG